MYGLNLNNAPTDANSRQILTQWGISDLRTLPVTCYDDYMQEMVEAKAPVVDVGALLEPLRLCIDSEQPWICEFEHDGVFYWPEELPMNTPVNVILTTAKLRRYRTEYIVLKQGEQITELCRAWELLFVGERRLFTLDLSTALKQVGDVLNIKFTWCCEKPENENRFVFLLEVENPKVHLPEAIADQLSTTLKIPCDVYFLHSGSFSQHRMQALSRGVPENLYTQTHVIRSPFDHRFFFHQIDERY